MQSNLARLDPEQRNSYPRLHRKAQAALEGVDAEIERIKNTFKTSQLSSLKRELKALTGLDIDPEQARLYTRYRENTEEDFNEYLARISGGTSVSEPKFTFSPPRTTRALDESRFIDRIHSLTLWEAACENFSYRTDSVLLKPYSFEQASFIDYAEGLKGQAAGPFVAIVRKLDLGAQLQRLLEEAAGPTGTLMQRVVDAAGASLEFDLLEALRNSPVSKVQPMAHEQLAAMLKGATPAHIWPVSMGLAKRHRFIHAPIDTGANGRLLFGSQDSFDFIGKGTVPLPLFIIKVPATPGVFSYFPNRLNGAVLWHRDVAVAFQQFMQQLRYDHGKGQLGWFVRQLAFKDMGFFNKLLSTEPRPAGMTWLAGVLYDSFRSTFPEPDLGSLHLTVEMSAADSRPLAREVAGRQMERYRSNLSMLASRKTDQDWQAFKEALADIGSEVLSLLTTPVPGGVLGLNRIMQGAILGSLAHSLVQGVIEAGRGDASAFASALADSIDLLVSGRMAGLAGKAHRQRMHTLWNRVGQPHKVTYPDGRIGLWWRDLSSYPQLDATVLSTLTPSPDGVYQHQGKRYALVQEGDQALAVEITFDPAARHNVVAAGDAHLYRPPVVFDPVAGVWGLALDDVQGLSDARLVQRMLALGSPGSRLGDIERMLSITATSREQLQDTWHGEPIPGPLADGVRRLMADRLIERLVTDVPLLGELPLNAGGAVLRVLTQLEHWPADVTLDVLDQQGVLIESHGKDQRLGAPFDRIEIMHLDLGSFVARDDVTRGGTGLRDIFGLILDLLPETSRLGREGNPGLDKAGRIAAIGEQIAALALEDKPLLFKALTALDGHRRSDPIALADAGRKYLPRVCPPISDGLSPLLAKLHELNPSLSIESIESLLATHPFSALQITRALEHGTQPVVFTDAAQRLSIKLRVDRVLDGIYHPRAYTRDIDLWTREFARGALHDKLDRQLVVWDVPGDSRADSPVFSGPDDTTVVLLHHGHGVYEVPDPGGQVSMTFGSSPNSFYLALTRRLRSHELSRLGMQGPSLSGLRQALGDAMLANRQPGGEVNLWDTTTTQYHRSVVVPPDLLPGELGLYDMAGKQYLSLYGVFFQVGFDAALQKWRFIHPEKVGVYTPVLEHNGDGAWRQKSENPLQWTGLQLLRRLRAEPEPLSDEAGHAIMAVSNTDEGVLRQVHMNNLIPPPVLIDTLKRFKIDREIRGFIKKMQAYNTLADARSDLQLLLMQSLPGWPRDKVLQVLDAQGNTLQEYGTDLDRGVPRIRIVRDETRNGNLLRALLTRLSEADTRLLLGDYPPDIEARILALARKIAAHALTRATQLFSSVYESLEKSSDAHVVLVKDKYPQLPKSVIENLIRHTTGQEKNRFLDKGMIAPRLAEQIPWSAREVRLARAYEGLYLGAATTPDSEMLTLHMLQSLPGWPGHVRIEVRSNDIDGQVLDSIGADDGEAARILVRRDDRYRAFSPEGQALNPASATDNNLLSSILHVLTDAERASIQIRDTRDTLALASKISELAVSHRARVKTLLGLEPPASGAKPVMKVDMSFIAYPLWLDYGQSSHPVDLVIQATSLYPALSYSDLMGLLDALGPTEASRRAEVVRLHLELETMRSQLVSWERIQLYPASGNEWAIALPGERRRACERIVSAWRRETEVVAARAGIDGGYMLDLIGIQAGDLPALAADFSHIRALHMDDMNLYQGSDAFLSSFSRLGVLSMSDNRLGALPPAIGNMTRLWSLDLARNRIVLTPQSVQQLAGCTALQALRLDNNPLNLTPDVSQMAGLRRLDLERTGIANWPVGLQGLTQVDEANLRHNQIVTIPQVLFEEPATMVINSVTWIHGNPLSAESNDRLIEYWGRTGIHMGFVPVFLLAHALVEADALRSDITPWLSSGSSFEQKEQRVKQWALLWGFEGQVGDFFRLLNGLAQAQEEMSIQSRLALQGRVWALIDSLLADTALRDLLFQGIHYDATCRDGVMVLLDNLEVQALIHQAERLATENLREAYLLSLAKGLFRLRQVDQIADAQVAERFRLGGHPDAAEIQLFYRIELAEALGLPIQTRAMFSAPIAGISAAQISEAKARILAMDASPAFKHSIMHETLWRNFLQKKHAERFEAIENQYQQDYTKLSEEAGLSEEVQLQRGEALTIARDQQINRLIEQLTDRALQGTDEAQAEAQ